MSIFDNDSGVQELAQFIQLMNAFKGMGDTTIEETRAVNLVNSKAVALNNQIKNMTSTGQMAKIKPLVDEFEKEIQLSGHEQ